MSPLRKTTIYLSAIVLVFLPEGCISLYSGRWTAVNLGGALNHAGMESPCKQKLQADDGQWDYHRRVWKKGERYLVEVPVAFVPFHPPIIEHSAGHRKARHSLDNRYWGPDEEEIAQYPAELYYADFSAEQFRRLCRLRKSDAFRDPFPGLKLTPQAEMDFSGATLIYDSHHKTTTIKQPEMENYTMAPMVEIIRIHTLPPRRSTKNLCLQPVRWAAEVVDIPLSLIATPIGWVVDAIYEPLNN